VNPKATSTNKHVRKNITTALEGALDVKVKQTKARNHAQSLAQQAVLDDYDVVAVLGGDGTVNEVINGLLSQPNRSAYEVPILGIIPGGHANVLAHALALPSDSKKAAKAFIDHMQSQSIRTIGLGKAGDRWFALHAGLGIDAEVVAAVEDMRKRGFPTTPGSYMAGLVKSWIATDRWNGPMTMTGVSHDDQHVSIDKLVFAIVQNTTPWTMLGEIALQASTQARFEQGLDVVSLESLSAQTMMRIAGTLLTGRGIGDLPESTVLTNLATVTMTSDRPVPLQIDGDLIKPVTSITFASVPDAIRVFTPVDNP